MLQQSAMENFTLPQMLEFLSHRPLLPLSPSLTSTRLTHPSSFPVVTDIFINECLQEYALFLATLLQQK